jgi:hypothetical protein
MAREPHQIGWERFADVAEELFKVLGRSELAWARQAWECLAKAGLADATTELDRHRVAIRFIAVASVYREFCAFAWKKNTRSHYAEWAVFLDLNSLRIGQLLGEKATLPEKAKEERLLDEAVAILANRERPQLHKALVGAWGGVSKLFISMWRTRERPEGGPGKPEPRETDDVILNDLSFEKIDAFEFVSKGFVPGTPPTGV